jgi:C4-dicarboxylate-specific signal transduction histidine kinase
LAFSLFALLAVLFSTAAAAAQQPPPSPPTRVLVAFAHDRNAPGVVMFAEQLHRVLGEELGPVEFYEEYLDLDRFPDPNRSPQLARQFAEKYRAFRPDVIVAEGSLALRFTVDHLARIFPRVPIVYGGAFEPILDFISLPANVTGIRPLLPFAPTFDLAKALQPDAERVVLVGGTSPMDSVVFVEGIEQITPRLGGLELIELREWSLMSLRDSLRAMPPNTIVILSSFRRDKSGYEFNSGDLITSLTRAAAVPVFGIARNWVGDGVVGGAVLQFANDGARTGELVVRVLRRPPGSPMPAQEVASTPLVVDWRQMQRWSLQESRLPRGTEVLFRTTSVWDRYWAVILAVLVLMTAESVLIGLLLLERKRRVRAQKAVEEQAAYEQMMAALRAYSARLSPIAAPEALEEALPRVGRFAGARAAVLVVDADDPAQPPTCLVWSDRDVRARTCLEAAEAMPPADAGAPIEIPLLMEDASYGLLALYRSPSDEWPETVRTRLKATADLLAGVLARARASRALQQTQGQIEHLARVATVGELAAAVSHELRQPLTAIRANAEAGALLLERTPLDVEEARAIFNDIVRDDERASDVIEHVRVLLRKQSPTHTLVDLNGICRHTARLLERDAKARGAVLELELDPGLPLIHGDLVQLEQVLINLALNALDAAAASKGHSVVVVGTAAAGGEVELFVHDTGPGLPPDFQRRGFQPFFTTKTHGLGLGLSIVRTIVERHRGRVRAENNLGGGASFTVTLPVEEATGSNRFQDARASGAPAVERHQPGPAYSVDQGPTGGVGIIPGKT